MASSFPGGLDNFTNPTASDALDSATVPHATQHSDSNDAIEAIESTLGVNPQGASDSVVARLNAVDSTVAGKAALASANAFTVGGHTITNASTSVIPLTFVSAASQSANMVEYRASNGTSVLGLVDAFGGAAFGGNNVLSSSLGIQTGGSATQRAITVRAAASQTADLQQLQNSSSTVLGGRNALGQIYSSVSPIAYVVGTTTTAATGTGSIATLTTSSATGLAVGDLIAVNTIEPAGYRTSGSIVTAVSNTSPFTVSYANTTTTAQTVAGFVNTQSQASITSRSAGTKGLVIRNAASQTAVSLEVQTSTGTPLAAIASDGGLRTVSISNSTGTVAQVIGASRNTTIGNTADHGGGQLTLAINNATVVPTTNPTSGGVVYVNTGALTYRGTSGGAVTLANADGTSPYVSKTDELYYAVQQFTTTQTTATTDFSPLSLTSTFGVALAASTTYLMDVELILSTQVAAANARTLSFGFRLGSGTLTNFYYDFTGNRSLAGAIASTASQSFSAGVGLQTVEAARAISGSYETIIRARGIVTVNAAAKLIPTLQWSAAGDTLVSRQGSYISFIPLPNAVSNGTWS